LATPKTRFHIVANKSVLYKKIPYYKGKELLLEYKEDVNPACFVKARPGFLFKHELEVLKHKSELITLEGYAIRRFYRL